MESFQAKLCLKKAVVVSVYEEKPTKRKVSSSSNQHHHHHYYVHHSIKQGKHGDNNSGKGYSRRAELLLYSKFLRESAHPEESSHHFDANPISSNVMQPKAKVPKKKGFTSKLQPMLQKHR